MRPPLKALPFLCVFVAMLVGFTGTGRAQDCSSPPRGSGNDWARSYRAWCTQCGGEPYTDSGNNPACRPGPNWGRKGDNDQPRRDTQLREDNEEARRKEAEDRERRERAERERREAEARRAEEERKEKFKRDQKDLLDSLKGVQGEPSLIKGEQGELQLKSGTKTLGIDPNPTTGPPLKELKNSGNSATLATAWQQLYCAAYTSNRAAHAALDGVFDEASYLTEQARRIMSEGKAEVGCLNIPEPPEPYGRERLNEKSTPLIKLYNLLMEKTEKEVSRLVELRKRFPDLRHAKQVRHQKVVETQMELQEVRRRRVNVRDPKEVKQKRSDLGGVNAALEAVLKAEAEVNQAEKEESEATKILLQVKETFAKVKEDPNSAQALLDELEARKPPRRR